MADTHNWYRDDATGQYVHNVSVLVDAPVETCFHYWSQFENFPCIMRHVTRVTKTGENSWHWEAEIAGLHEAWDAEMPEYAVNRKISWRATGGVKNAGVITFMPENGKCRITVHLTYDPPFGVVGDLVAQARVNQIFHADLEEDLRNFKAAMESGQVERFRPAA